MYSHVLACIRMYLHVFACICMHRDVSKETIWSRCIEYVYRGARSIHVFGIGEIHEIHARYKGKQNGGGRGARHKHAKKRAIHDDTQIGGESDARSGEIRLSSAGLGRGTGRLGCIRLRSGHRWQPHWAIRGDGTDNPTGRSHCTALFHRNAGKCEHTANASTQHALA